MCMCAHAHMGVHTHSVMSDSVTPWTVAHQAPLSMKFSRQENWSGLPFSPPGDLPNPGIKLTSLLSSALQANSLPWSHWGSPLITISGLYNLVSPGWPFLPSLL